MITTNRTPVRFQLDVDPVNAAWTLTHIAGDRFIFIMRIEYNCADPAGSLGVASLWTEGECAEIVETQDAIERRVAAAKQRGTPFAEAEKIRERLVSLEDCDAVGHPARLLIEDALATWQALRILVDPAAQ